MPEEWLSETNFVSSDESGIYNATFPGNVLRGGTLSWARISEGSLTVYRMEIEEEGIPEIQIFRRTLTPEGLEFKFTAQRDGVERRSLLGLYLRQ